VRSLPTSVDKLDVFREPVRALLDRRPAKAATKRWGWVKKGAPIVIEVGGRDLAAAMSR
jgi:prolyl-tRNA synthetase